MVVYIKNSMKVSRGLTHFFGLDISTSAIRVVQLSATSNGWNLMHYGHASVDPRIVSSDSAEARQRLGESILTVVEQSGIKTNNVAVGLPSTRTFTTIIDVPKVTHQELTAMMKHQIDQYIPGISSAEVSWAVLGDSLRDKRQYEVLLSSTSKDYAEQRMELVEALGFDVIAEEPDTIAMARSLTPQGAQDARLILDMGNDSSDLVVMYNETPRLVRTIPIGLAALVQAAARNINDGKEDQVRQLILKFGLSPNQLEKQIFDAISDVMASFMKEVTQSIKFFQTRYPSLTIGAIHLSGFSAVIPEMGAYMSVETNISTKLASPWQRVSMSAGDESRLKPVASEFAVAVGLAQRRNLS